MEDPQYVDDTLREMLLDARREIDLTSYNKTPHWYARGCRDTILNVWMLLHDGEELREEGL